MVRLSNEIYERHCSPNGKARMTRLQSEVFAIPPVAGAVETTKFCQILCQRREVMQNQADGFCPLGLIRNTLRYKFKLFS